MALSNFTNISSAVADWLNRTGNTNITDKVPDFMDLGQRKIMRVMRIPPMEVVTTITPDANGKAAVPNDYLETKYLVAANQTSAWPLTPSTFSEVLSRQTNPSANQPLTFDVEGGFFYIGAVPVQNETFTLVYYKEIEFVTASVAQSWFSLYAPDLLLFAALQQAAIFMKDLELEKEYEERFMTVKAELELQRDRGEHSGGPLVVRAI